MQRLLLAAVIFISISLSFPSSLGESLSQSVTQAAFLPGSGYNQEGDNKRVPRLLLYRRLSALRNEPQAQDVGGTMRPELLPSGMCP